MRLRPAVALVLALGLGCEGSAPGIGPVPPPPPPPAPPPPPPPPPPSPTGRFAFTGVVVLPMDTERWLAGHTVVVSDGTITALGPDGAVDIPADATVIDGTGKWLMPGLIDMHTHERALPQWPEDFAGNAVMFLANGVTSIVNMGDFTGDMLAMRAAVASGAIPGPTVYVGQMVRGTTDGGTPVASTAEAARQIAAQAWSEGYDLLKVYDGVPRVAFDALIDEGRSRGLAVTGHAITEAGVRYVIENGQVMVAHSHYFIGLQGGSLPADDAALAAYARSTGVAVTATLYVNELITNFGLDALAGQDVNARVRAQTGIEYMDDRAITAWRGMMQQRSDIRSPTDRRGFQARMLQVVKALHDAGVPVLLGSDEIGIPGVVPGFSIHGEIDQLRLAGLTPFQALGAGTAINGRFIRDHVRPDLVGTVAVGSRADLLLLDRDPLLDPGTLRHPAGVMAAGRWYTRTWLESELDRLRTTR